MNRDEQGKFTGYEGPVTPLKSVEDPYAPDPRTILKLVRPDMDYTAEDYARDVQTDLDTEAAEAFANEQFAAEMRERGITDDDLKQAERDYEDYSTYRGIVGL